MINFKGSQFEGSVRNYPKLCLGVAECRQSHRGEQGGCGVHTVSLLPPLSDASRPN
jgi:hypothetical protein